MINTLRDIKINAIDATVLQEMISQDNLKIVIVRQGVEFKLILSPPPPHDESIQLIISLMKVLQ